MNLKYTVAKKCRLIYLFKYMQIPLSNFCAKSCKLFHFLSKLENKAKRKIWHVISMKKYKFVVGLKTFIIQGLSNQNYEINDKFYQFYNFSKLQVNNIESKDSKTKAIAKSQSDMKTSKLNL